MSRAEGATKTQRGSDEATAIRSPLSPVFEVGLSNAHRNTPEVLVS